MHIYFVIRSLSSFLLYLWGIILLCSIRNEYYFPSVLPNLFENSDRLFSQTPRYTPFSNTLLIETWISWKFWYIHIFVARGRVLHYCTNVKSTCVCRQTSWARYIHKHVTFPVKSCQTNLYRGEREYLDSNVFLHGSCTSYKSCNGETTKISPSLLFEHERRRRSFLCEYRMWDWWRFRNKVWQNNALMKNCIFSVTRRSRSDESHWVTYLLTYWVMVSRQYWCDSGEWGYLLETWLMWLWWVRIPVRDLTGESYLVMKVI